MSAKSATEQQEAPARMSLADRATVVLRDAILDLSIAPNARLDERFLQDTFGISRTPAREAMNRLLAEGFLAFRQGFGVYARPLNLSDITSFFDAYFAEEKMIAHFCNFDDKDLVADLEQINVRHMASLARVDGLGVQRDNRAFHVRIAQACANFHVLRFAEQMHDHAQRLTSLIYRMEAQIRMDPLPEIDKINDFHRIIIDAIQARDRPRLSVAMTDHARQFHERVCRIVTLSQGASFEL